MSRRNLLTSFIVFLSPTDLFRWADRADLSSRMTDIDDEPTDVTTMTTTWLPPTHWTHHLLTSLHLSLPFNLLYFHLLPTSIYST
jgi:hypothetical protein